MGALGQFAGSLIPAHKGVNLAVSQTSRGHRHTPVIGEMVNVAPFFVSRNVLFIVLMYVRLWPVFGVSVNEML